MSLLEKARAVRENAYAPYSGFRVGAAIRAVSGRIYVGCNVENASYPESMCAEAGAIAAMVAAGETELAEVAIIGEGPDPVSPCGGCRQKMIELARDDVRVTMGTISGRTEVMALSHLLPGAFRSERSGRR